MDALRGITSEQMLFLDFDVKPDFRDTPRDWQWQLEGAFASGGGKGDGKGGDQQ